MLDTTDAVVVGIDGSDAAVAAARWAAALAVQLNAPLHLVHGQPAPGWAVGDASAALLVAASSYHRENAAQFLSEAAEAVRAAAPTLSVTTEAPETAAAEALIEASTQARLIVVAGHTTSAAQAAVLGSTTLAVATHARCPVISWRAGAAASISGPVVVGVAYSEDGAGALDAAFDFADQFGVDVTAVHTWRQRRTTAAVTIPMLVDWEAVEEAELVQLNTVVDEVAATHPDVKYTCVLDTDKPAGAILERAADAGLVVVGSRGRGPLKAAMLGSTGLNLLHHSPVPVMIVRATNNTP